MSASPNPDLHLEHCLHHKDTRPRELTTIPVEHLLTAAQERHQRTPQLGLENIVENISIEENVETPKELPDLTTNLALDVPLNFGNLDIHALLTALVQQAILPVRKRTKGIKEPNLFSGGSPDKL